MGSPFPPSFLENRFLSNRSSFPFPEAPAWKTLFLGPGKPLLLLVSSFFFDWMMSEAVPEKIDRSLFGVESTGLC